jgi:hypothetical protein
MTGKNRTTPTAVAFLLLGLGVGQVGGDPQARAHEPDAQPPEAASAETPPLPMPAAPAVVYGSPAYRPAYQGVYARGGWRRARYVVAYSGRAAAYPAPSVWLSQWPFVPELYFSHPPIWWGQWPVGYAIEPYGQGMSAYRPIYPGDPLAASLMPAPAAKPAPVIPPAPPAPHPNEGKAKGAPKVPPATEKIPTPDPLK